MILLYALALSLPPNTLATSTNVTSLFDPVTGDCIDISGCRTVTGILWSCLSVILICTWVAIHPNIPEVGTHPAVVIYRDIELMVIVILTPEIMILWAMRQWYSAKAIAKQFKKYGWGMPHAFFTIMGGFALYDGDKFRGYLWNDEEEICSEDGEGWGLPQEQSKRYIQQIKKHIQKAQGHSPQGNTLMYNAGSIDQPEESINLLGKGISEPPYLLEYFLQKGYIAITEDEIKDKSHADFIAKSIALIQTTWFILQVAVRAAEGLTITELEIITVGFALLNFGTYFLWWHKPLRVRYPAQVTWRQWDLATSQSERSWMETIQEGAAAIWGYISGSNGRPDNLLLAIQLIFLPLQMIWSIIITSIDLFRDQPSTSNEFPTRLKQHPTQIYIIVYSIAAAFGAIHCILWAFKFPTHTEQLLWQICAVAVAAAPIVMGCLHWWWKQLSSSTPKWLRDLIMFTAILLGIFYIFSRIMLIALTLTALRDLSPSAYQTVEWTILFPHIG